MVLDSTNKKISIIAERSIGCHYSRVSFKRIVNLSYRLVEGEKNGMIKIKEGKKRDKHNKGETNSTK